MFAFTLWTACLIRTQRSKKLWYLTVQDLGLLLLLGLGLGAGGVGGAGGVQGGLESLAILLEVATDFSDPLLDCKKIHDYVFLIRKRKVFLTRRMNMNEVKAVIEDWNKFCSVVSASFQGQR